MPARILGLVPYDILTEPWNEYKIKDKEDVLLRGRFLLTKVLRVRDSEKPERKRISIGAQSLWVTQSPESLRGKPSAHLPTVTEIKEDERKEMKVEIVKEDWNNYKIVEEKVELRIRQVITRVYKIIGYFSGDGEPYFVVESTAILEAEKENGMALRYDSSVG